MAHPKLRVSAFACKAILFESCFLVLALGSGWFLDFSPLRQFCFSWQLVVCGVIATVPPLLLLLWCTHSHWNPIARLAGEVKANILPLFETCSLLDFALIAVVAGVAEESLFRGVIQPALTNLVGPWGAIVLTGILFGLLHFVTPTYAVLAALIGTYLGWLINASGNLLIPIIVHALYDFLALVYTVRVLRKKES